MNDLEVRIVTLDAMRVASAYGFGASPEGIAFEKIEAFASANNLLEEGKLPHTFGFNDPDPAPGSPNYGYEVWLPIEENIEPAGDIRIIDFAGGLYAVAPCRGVQNIGNDWLALAKWREGTQYAAGKHQWLEHLLSSPGAPPDEMVFDLYLPIAE